MLDSLDFGSPGRRRAVGIGALVVGGVFVIVSVPFPWSLVALAALTLGAILVLTPAKTGSP